MAKKSALDLKIAECDAGMAEAHEDLARWRALRAFLTGSAEPAHPTEGQATAPKRTRVKAKRLTVTPVEAKPDHTGVRENEQ